MGTVRNIKDRNLTHRFVCIDRTILQNPLLSLEGKGYYVTLESGSITINDVPKNIIEELISVGYISEVNS